jgi:hypothetical protein
MSPWKQDHPACLLGFSLDFCPRICHATVVPPLIP